MVEYVSYVLRGFRILQTELPGFVGQMMSTVYRDRWWEEVRDVAKFSNKIPVYAQYAELVDSMDILLCLNVMQARWNRVFSEKLSPWCRLYINELKEYRNTFAHIGREDYTQRQAERAVDTMLMLSEEMDLEITEQLKALYHEIRYGVVEDAVVEPVASVAENEPVQFEISVGEGKNELLYCKRRGCMATGVYNGINFVVLKGSRIADSLTPTCPRGAVKNREKYNDLISSSLETLEDITFGSASAAACFVLGSSANGNVEWKNAEGITLKELQEQE